MFDLNKITQSLKTTVEVMYITDITAVASRRKEDICVPQGYEKIDVDLNEGAGGDYIYLCIKRGSDQENAIDDIRLISQWFKGCQPPAGYEKVDLDLNKGAGGRYIYLCKHRGSNEPLLDIKVLRSSSRNVTAPEGYTLLSQDLNEGAGGKYIYICYARKIF